METLDTSKHLDKALARWKDVLLCQAGLREAEVALAQAEVDLHNALKKLTQGEVQHLVAGAIKIERALLTGEDGND